MRAAMARAAGVGARRRLHAEAGNIEIRLTAIKPRPSFNVLVLTKNAGSKKTT